MAGILLAESPFATQIRAEVGSLRTLFVTLFFSSIGMLGDPVWAAGHWIQIVAVVALISTIAGLVDWSYDWADRITVIGFWLLALLMAGVVVLIVRRRRGFVLIRVRRQWWLAAACVALVLPAVAGVFLLLFFVAWR